MTTPPTGTPVLDLLSRMTADSIEAARLDSRTWIIARIAALVAVNAPPASYLANLGAASDLDVGVQDVRGLLLAIAPVVGTVRIASALGNIARALGIALEAAELGNGSTSTDEG